MYENLRAYLKSLDLDINLSDEHMEHIASLVHEDDLNQSIAADLKAWREAKSH